MNTLPFLISGDGPSTTPATPSISQPYVGRAISVTVPVMPVAPFIRAMYMWLL
jgi:hypothetical protein